MLQVICGKDPSSLFIRDLKTGQILFPGILDLLGCAIEIDAKQVRAVLTVKVDKIDVVTDNVKLKSQEEKSKATTNKEKANKK